MKTTLLILVVLTFLCSAKAKEVRGSFGSFRDIEAHYLKAEKKPYLVKHYRFHNGEVAVVGFSEGTGIPVTQYLLYAKRYGSWDLILNLNGIYNFLLIERTDDGLKLRGVYKENAKDDVVLVVSASLWQLR